MKGPRAKRRLGQHFLSDPRILARIAEATGAGQGDTVLEIGPGPGGLTAALVKLGARVVAIEKDPDVLPALKSRAPGAAVVEADALEVDWHAAAGSPARWFVAGNIPYNITSPLIDKALTPPRPVSVVFLVQKEVALRVGAAPGTADYGALTVGVQAVATAERLFNVPAGAFSPAPRVDSAVLRLTPLAQPMITDEERAGFRAMVVGLFGFRRKQLLRAVRELTGWDADRAGAVLSAAFVHPSIRPESVTIAEFVTLYRSLVDSGLYPR